MKLIKYISSILQHIFSMLVFESSEEYWIERYRRGGNSGRGSYGDFARFKADTINSFVEKNSINTVIEFGCGDGNQLTLAKYPSYIGFDISPSAIEQCKKIFSNDSSKEFYLMSEYKGQNADMTLSLDVIYHLIEDKVFEKHMLHLFNSSKKYVLIYSSNEDSHLLLSSPHVKHRQFTRWIKKNVPDWVLANYIPNTSMDNTKIKVNIRAAFFIYQKKHVRN